ncbi:hypothetical protein Tco_0050145, partial [Tanacetum coccineum]
MIQSQPTESTQGTHRTLSAPRQSARLTPPAPLPTTEKADEMILQDMIQVSLAEQKSREEQEARENVALVAEHLAVEEIEKLVEDSENVDDEEDEITDEVFELRRRVKGKNVEETRISPIPSPTRSPRNLSTLGRYGYLFAHLKKRFMPWTSSDQLADNLHDVMMETLPLKTTKEETERLISKAILQERRRMQAHISSQIHHVNAKQIQSSSIPEQQYQLYLAMKADPL